MVTPSQDQKEPITFVHYGCLENSDLRPQTSPKLSPPNLENSDLENLDPPPSPPLPPQIYSGCQRLFVRGFQFRSS